jgi:3-oxoacyl-[acyl-carrier-protein] synthase II
MKRRVVITGVGAVSGLGMGVEPFWEGLVAGRSAIKPITRFDPTGFRSRLAAEVPGFSNARDYVPKHYRKATKVMARDTDLVVAAARLALDDARLVTRGTQAEEAGPLTPTYAGPRLGCQIGAGLIAAEIDELTAALSTACPAGGGFSLRAWGTAGDGSGGGMNNLPPLWMLKYLPNMLACHVTILHGAEGPSNTVTAMQASGLLCLGESFRVIERGDADACFSGGAESPINLLRHLRLELIGWLAATEGAASGLDVLKPYDEASLGGLAGEGGGILILEEREAARARGATAYAEVVGFGSAQSAPEHDAEAEGMGYSWSADGLQYAAENAIADAGLSPGDIDAVIPQASGVPALDAAEAAALRAVFGDRLGAIPLVTMTPLIGDCLAGAGGLAAAAAAACLRYQRLPARLHAGECPADLAAGPAPACPAPLRNVLVMTGSVGGQNAGVVLARAS